ncbi:MAG: hypothetical protein ACREN5_05930 [Gemmatimonadales bacterium]
MLDPWIIDEIRKREEERRRDSETVQQLPDEIPVSRPDDPATGPPARRDHPGRGIVVVDYTV